MLKKLLLIISVLLFRGFISAQNLVPNPSFETYSDCPTADGQLDLATGWFDPTGTEPDYFNACASSGSGFSVPENDFGNMNANTGNAYAGIFTYFLLEPYTNIREYMEIQLSSPLEAGKIYNVSFYVARAAICDYAASTIGAYFSVNSIHPPQYCDDSIKPQVENDSSNLILSTTEWTQITGSFIAGGGEEFLTIGNFKTSDNSKPIAAGGTAHPGAAYYYIDDIAVTKDLSTGIVDAASNNPGISIYPNPSTDGQFHIALSNDLKSRGNLFFTMYDYTGKEVMRKALAPLTDQIISTDNISQGLYICKLFAGNKEFLLKKILILNEL